MKFSEQGEEISIEFQGDFIGTEESVRIKKAFDDALANRHALNEVVLSLDGMSGYGYRKFINNLTRLTPNARHLEIGVWKGSTVCSVIWNNKCKVTAIDNWTEFGAPKSEFEKNLNSCKNDDVEFSIIEKDFRQIDYTNIGKYSSYMFDGPHLPQDQYDGIAIAQPALDDTYIQIVDDWNNLSIQTSTRHAITDLGLEILSEIVVTSNHDGSSGCTSPWHNGYLIAVIRKPK
jgi:hypothetical protein